MKNIWNYHTFHLSSQSLSLDSSENEVRLDIRKFAFFQFFLQFSRYFWQFSKKNLKNQKKVAQSEYDQQMMCEEKNHFYHFNFSPDTLQFTHWF